MLKKIMNKFSGLLLFLFFIFVGFFSFFAVTHAAVLSITPPTGTFTVGSTFEVSVYLNTENQTINAIQTAISFPPDKLQLVSPSTGKSVIGVWTAQPTVNNQSGRVDLQGGVPGGINVSNGLITTLTFRVKAVGSAAIRFLDDSKILLHDGRGSNVLNNTSNGIFELVLPPPAGPLVVSETHNDQSQWYKNKNVFLSWQADSEVEGYSYEMSDDPAGLPDDVLDSSKTSVSYREVVDGVHYFHIKALRGGTWGGTTHFAIKIDSTEPADFPIKIIPSTRTTRRQPIFDFNSTDENSGLSHYELKMFPLDRGGKQPLFVEVTAPFVPEELALGQYLVVVRAYDFAGNYREVSKKFSVVSSAFQLFDAEGVRLGNKIFIPWVWAWLLAIIILLLLVYLAYKARKRHQHVELRSQEKQLPDPLKKQLEDLQKYRERFGNLAVLLVMLVFSFMVTAHSVKAADPLATPTITLLSDSITNKEIFYLGGRVEIPESSVSIFLQNKETQETYTYSVQADKLGEWFYRHTAFLPSGTYTVWVQGKLAALVSAPSGQREIIVKRAAVQFAGARLSYEFLYLILLILFALATIGLLTYVIYHHYWASKKHKILAGEIKQAEESIKRGFAVLRRDIETELTFMRNTKGKDTPEGLEKEKQLLTDLAEVEARLEREIWEIEEQEGRVQR